MNSTPAPLVTVYITSHNYGRFLEQAIQSVLGQTLNDFELIIIDDGSTDNSREIIERYTDHEQIKAIFQHNKGLNVTNNIAVRAARGRYVMRLDADDYLDDHALQLLSDTLNRDPSVGLVFPDYYRVDRNGTVLELVRRHNFDDVTLFDQPAHGACTMIRREYLEEIGGYDESYRCQDGYDLWIRFIEHFKVCNVNLPLFYYRQHSASMTQNEKQILETRAEILKRATDRSENNLSTLVVVPVRGPQYDPASRALDFLGEKTLIDWTLKAAFDSDRIRDVLVTTPDTDVLSHVRSTYGDLVITVEREPSMAMHNTLLAETVRDAVNAYENDHDPTDAIMQLGVEAPFRTARHLNSAVSVMEIFDTDAVVGVRPDTDVLYRHNGGGLTPIMKSSNLRLEQEDVFREVGMLRMYSRRHLTNDGTVLPNRVGHIILDQRAALTIRTDLDWEIAELLASNDLLEKMEAEE